MADRPQPSLNEALMALFASAAPLVERAKASGLFRDRPIDVTPETQGTAKSAPDADAAKHAALHDIIVAQAQKIVALEAEIARLKG